MYRLDVRARERQLGGALDQSIKRQARPSFASNGPILRGRGLQKEESKSMRKNTVGRAIGQSRISMFHIAVITFAFGSLLINAAGQAAEAGKDASTATNRARVLVLATGGTIAGQADPRATGA